MLPQLQPNGTLPPGRHLASLRDLRLRFVDEAPFAEHRREIFDAFEIWARVWWELLPGTRLWVNGGFVVHKSTKPKDIDVVGFAKPSQVEALTANDQSRLESLLTLIENSDGGRRIQPMGGLVDGFYAPRAVPEKFHYWDELWSTLTDENKEPVPGVTKGYVEVKDDA